MTEKKRSGPITHGQPIPEMRKMAGEDTPKKGQPIPPPPRLIEREDTKPDKHESNQSNTESETSSDDK